MRYTNRELDHYFSDIKASLLRIEAENIAAHTKLDENQKRTNGKVATHSKILLIVGATIATLLITNSSELIKLFSIII